MKITLRIFGIIGIILFGTAFGLTYRTPGFVEDIARGFIKQRIEDETRAKIDNLRVQDNESKLKKLTAKVMKGHEAEIEKTKQQLKNKVHEKIAAVAAEMQDLDCACREKFSQRIKKGLELRILSDKNAVEKLTDFMKSKYMEIAIKIKKDFRIFTGANLSVFLVLFLISFLKPKAVVHLFLPGMLLFISTMVCSCFYLFEQNWFFTIIYDDYLGYGYLAYLGLVFAFLCDVVFNRGRVTTAIINAICEAIGAAISVAPC